MSKFDYEIDDFIGYCDSKGLSKKSMRSYEHTLMLFAKYLKYEQGMESTKEATDSYILNIFLYKLIDITNFDNI